MVTVRQVLDLLRPGTWANVVGEGIHYSGPCDECGDHVPDYPVREIVVQYSCVLIYVTEDGRW